MLCTSTLFLVELVGFSCLDLATAEMLVSMALGTVLELVSYMIPQFYNHGVEKDQSRVSSCMACTLDHFILDELMAVECKLCRLPTPGSASGCRA
jgi:hypothetical protein